MDILVSNDDGVHAAGINALADALREIATVRIVGPDRNRSGASNSLSLTRPLRIKKLADDVIAVEGTPTDCVHIATTGLLDSQPDLVVSGINHGANLGDDILYSGTVAAAMEGRYLGFPAIAISLQGEQPQHFAAAAKVAKNLVERLKSNPLPKNIILNVNVPDLPFEELKGLQVTRLGTRHGAEPTIKTLDPRGSTIYWIGPPGAEQDSGQGTDFHAVSNGYVSITPLHIDLTHYSAMDHLAGWVEELQAQD